MAAQRSNYGFPKTKQGWQFSGLFGALCPERQMNGQDSGGSSKKWQNPIVGTRNA
jgi:hypothetical protein